MPARPPFATTGALALKQDAASAATDVELDGLRLTVGTTLGAATLDGAGDVQVVVSTVWGVDADGDPYFDAAGAAAGQESALIIMDDGSLAVAGVGE